MNYSNSNKSFRCYSFCSQYFESTLVPRLCEDELSLAESRIRASAEYFGASCKAGPWVPDPAQDRILSMYLIEMVHIFVTIHLIVHFTERKYPSLCELCYNPESCAKGDKHWGRRGPLYCLTSGYGEVAWVRLDDVKSHFGVNWLKFEHISSFKTIHSCSSVGFQLKAIRQSTVSCVPMVTKYNRSVSTNRN